ncbi:hypothetical protein ACOSP7_000413 [Xanthoceras sorbifolium]
MDGGDVDDDDGGMKPPVSAVSCSICLDVVSDSGGRSRAKLHCGHEFHLDCIGSAFNMKELCSAQIVERLRKVNGYMQTVLLVHFVRKIQTKVAGSG